MSNYNDIRYIEYNVNVQLSILNLVLFNLAGKHFERKRGRFLVTVIDDCCKLTVVYFH